MIFEYGAMSSKYSIEADDKLTAYAGMVIHFGNNAMLVALYSPEEIKQDSWLMANPIEKRLDEVFGGEGAFFKYLDENKDKIKAALDTIKTII